MKNDRRECVSGLAGIHAHFVYGMDDGAKTREDMEAMLDAAYADGITSLVATPHMTPGIKPSACTWTRPGPTARLRGIRWRCTPARSFCTPRLWGNMR